MMSTTGTNQYNCVYNVLFLVSGEEMSDNCGNNVTYAVTYAS